MSERFYCWQSGDPELLAVALPEGGAFEIWRPSEGLKGAVAATDIAWWAFTHLGLFARPDFAALRIVRDGAVLHRLIVTPRWYRFPDMASDDLQLGDLWTEPAIRGRGLARAAIAEAHRLYAGRFKRMWYLTDSGNAASIRLIEACGYRLAGEGERTKPLGIGAIGQFRMKQP